ncbi:hypothetical protein [Nocardia sp. NPDC052112]|uniref:hypothetical protein n=1 Tax=Nocardia sp. NPDC052112 TaxID=3155646 RepID=UPI00341FAD13
MSWREAFDNLYGVSDDDVRVFMADMHATVTAHVAAFRRGEMPPIEELIGATRALNVAQNELRERIRDQAPASWAADYSTLFELARDIETRIPVLREIAAATIAIFDSVGILAGSADELVPSGLQARYLGGTAYYAVRAVRLTPWAEESTLPPTPSLPRYTGVPPNPRLMH